MQLNLLITHIASYCLEISSYVLNFTLLQMSLNAVLVRISSNCFRLFYQCMKPGMDERGI